MLEGWFWNVDIEADSMVLVQVLRGKMEVPWCISYEVRETQQLMYRLNCLVMHTFRESNRGADYLAIWGCSHQKNMFLRVLVIFPKC